MDESRRLKDLLEFTRDGEWGKGEPDDDLVEMAVIRGTDFASVRQGDVSSVPRRFIPKKASDRKSLVPGDLLIETAGGTKDQPTGRTVYLSERIFEALAFPVTCASFSRFLRVNREIVNPKYLFWYLQSIYATGEMLPFHIQHTGVARFQYTDFASQWQVPLPPIEEQAEIADTLSLFDDKIDLNRRMNESLEAMARAIFKDWFVDFGPTRAKAEGRAPYLAPELWKLFPDTLDDEGKPVGWETRKLEAFLRLNYGKSLPARKRTPGNVAVYGSGGLTGSHDTALIEGPVVIVGRKGTVGSIFWENGPAFPIDTVFYVEPLIGSMLFCYQLLACLPLSDMNTDAAVPGLNRGNAYRLEFPLPDTELMSTYEDIVGALWARRANNLSETRTLAQTRDLLLPKLMSGQMRLPDVERVVRAVA